MYEFKFDAAVRKFITERNEEIRNNNLGIDLIFFGDSITRRLNITRYYPSDKRILNSGIGGDNLNNMKKRIDEDVISLKPSEVVFLGGINDIRNWYLEGAKDEGVFINYIVDSYIEIITKLSGTNIKVYPCFLLYTCEEEFNYHYLNSVIKKINCKLEEFFESNNYHALKYNIFLSNEYDELIRNFANDGLHPDEVGYWKISQYLKQKKII
ncbi:MAG: GDSL-type esterase/lipase family protein [Erysipelotrichaceae bacterium]